MTQTTKYWRFAQRLQYTVDGATTYLGGLSLNYTCGRNGVSLPRWQDIIANHGNATTPFTGVDCGEEGFIPASITVRVKPVGAALTRYGVNGWLTRPTVLYSANALPYSQVDNQARAKFYSEINKAVSEFYAGPFLGEIRETISMLKKPLRGIREHLDRYLDHVLGYVNGKPVPRRHRPRRKRNISSFRKYNQAEKLEVIGNTWLEVRFGMLPLIKDINSFLKSIGDLIDVDQILPVSAWAENVEANYAFTSTPELHNNHVRVITTLKATGKTKVRYKGAVLVKATAPGLSGWVRGASHLGPRDFVPTLVELCPFSWLADYFINVSDVVNSIFIDLSPLQWYCRTIRRSIYHDCSGVVDVAAMKAYLGTAYQGFSGGPGFTRIRTTHVTRDVPILGMVTPAVSFPTWPASLMNMGALMLRSRSISAKLEALS
jgi:hypothetical protein